MMGILIVVMIILLFVRPHGCMVHHNHRDIYSRKNSLDILKERYAQGEISDQEYEEKRRRLQY